VDLLFQKYFDLSLLNWINKIYVLSLCQKKTKLPPLAMKLLRCASNIDETLSTVKPNNRWSVSFLMPRGEKDNAKSNRQEQSCTVKLYTRQFEIATLEVRETFITSGGK
jgi:hypothetical protein